MWSKKKTNLPAMQDRPALQTQMPPSFLAGDLMVEGTFFSPGSVVIEGRIDGSVCAARLTIGEKGFVHGNLIASEIAVRGRVTGDVHASDVRFGAHSTVDGNVCYRALLIEAGARFNGDCRYSANLPEGVFEKIMEKIKHLQGDTSSQTATPSSQQNRRTGEESHQTMEEPQLYDAMA